MRNALILVCVALQIAVLAYMVYGRESIISDGQRIYIATAPIDPRDPFRGDYVRLQYRLNDLNSAPNLWSDPAAPPKKGAVIYAELMQKPSGLFDVKRFTDTPPSNGPYLRGRMRPNRFSFDGTSTAVRFGIEQLFVQQGEGITIEEMRGVRGGMQIAMEVEVAVSEKGEAVLVGYRWSDLGIALDRTGNFTAITEAVDTPDAVDATGFQVVNQQPQLIVTVQNVSQKEITINNPGDNCGFRIEPANFNSAFFEAESSCSNIQSVELLRLLPGESHAVDLFLADPRWHVSRTADGITTTGDLRTFTQSSETFRVVYRSSSGNNNAGLVTEIWVGDLISQGFSVQGFID